MTFSENVADIAQKNCGKKREVNIVKFTVVQMNSQHSVLTKARPKLVSYSFIHSVSQSFINVLFIYLN